MAEITTPTPLTSVPKSNKVRQILKWVGFFLGGLFLLIVAYVAFMLIKMNYLPANLDYSTRLMSDQGFFSIAYTPQVDAITVNQMHSWTLHVETPDGKPVENAQISVDGFYALTLLVIPITIAFSIQQYRLWEFDPIIKRSLVYGFLTLFLGLIYAGYALLPPEIHR